MKTKTLDNGKAPDLLEEARREAENDYYGTDYLDPIDKRRIFIEGAQFIINKLNELKSK